MGLEGMPRQTSTHACGIVITKDPVDTYVPLYVRDNQISTQYIMTTLEELGLLKMDFLGLRTLTVIQDTINLVEKNRGIKVEYDKDMADPKVYKFIVIGNLIDRKSVNILLEALCLVKHKEKIIIDIVGDGPMRKSLEA